MGGFVRLGLSSAVAFCDYRVSRKRNLGGLICQLVGVSILTEQLLARIRHANAVEATVPFRQGFGLTVVIRAKSLDSEALLTNLSFSYVTRCLATGHKQELRDNLSPFGH